MENEDFNKERPALSLFITDPFRSLIERYNSQSLLTKDRYAGIGDGHSVLVIPGFMGNDQSTELIRGFLEHMGYSPMKWGLGRNLANYTNYIKLAEKIDDEYSATGKTVSVIGWSMGGIYARLIAHRRPDTIRQVITLGSPFRWRDETTNATWLYEFVNKVKNNPKPSDEVLALMSTPPPLPTTSIYSKSDGVVPWTICIEEEEDSWHQNIQVNSSHLGLPNNKTVLKVIADRLQYDKTNWIQYPKNTVR